ncbi:hypothetical protein FGE05_07205 [Pseudomonas sp. ICMP22404]|nr:hypothetical protein FGE05_07205 [Pseudomonas sp. ICMP22404]
MLAPWPIVGASLLAIAVGLPAPVLKVPPSSRAGSLPQRTCGGTQILLHRGPIVGASLLAIAVGLFAPVLKVPPSSRAGSLPQGSSVRLETCRHLGPMWERACSRRRCVSRQDHH